LRTRTTAVAARRTSVALLGAAAALYGAGMRSPSVAVALLSVALGACCSQPGAKATAPPVAEPVPPDPDVQLPPTIEEPPAVAKPFPPTRRDDLVETLHGQTVADPYRWLEDEHAPEVVSWMDAQDAYARAELAKLPGRDAIAARLREVFYFDALGAPTHRKGRYFYSRKHADKEKTVVYWKQGERGAEQVLFDPNTWSTDGSSGLGGWWPSRDGKYVAYAKKENNADETVTYLRDVATGKDLPDVIAGTKYASVSWTPDSKGFYYTWVPPVGGDVTIANRPGYAELRFHKVGADPATDAMVHPRTGNPQTFLRGGLSWDGAWLFAGVQHGWNSSDVYFKPAADPKAPWTTLVAGVPANFEVTAWKGRFYVNTNDGAPRYQVFAVDPRKPARADWKLIIAQNDDTLENVDVIGGQLVVSYLRNVTSAIEIHGLDGKRLRSIALPPLGTASSLLGTPDEDTAYFGFASFTEAAVNYQTSIKTGKVREWSRVKLPIDTSGFVVEQVRYPSKDGTPIPMFLLRKKDAPRDGSNRVLLYGYGGFNVSLTPGFSSPARCGSSSAACTPSPTCAAAASTARTGTRPACAEQAERVRRLHRRRPLPDRSAAGPTPSTAGDLRRVERRPAGRRGDDPGARAVQARWCAACRCSTWSATTCSARARPGSPSTATADDAGAVRGAVRLLAVPPGPSRRHPLPGAADDVVGSRRPRRSDARPQVHRRGPARVAVGRAAGLAADREERRPRRRRRRPPAGRAERRPLRLPRRPARHRPVARAAPRRRRPGGGA
jgi:prolyl oligopeptidase